MQGDARVIELLNEQLTSELDGSRTAGHTRDIGLLVSLRDQAAAA